MSTEDKSNVAMPAFNVLFIGAGGIVFGNDWVRWNHSAHLERILGDRLRVVGIVDPNSDRFEWVMNRKRTSSAKGSYADTRHYTTIEQAASHRKVTDEDAKNGPVHLIMLASPPEFRGSMSPGRDLEAQLVAAFGSEPAIFAEKPVTIGSSDGAYAVAHHLSKSGNLVGVGYMLRYLKVVQKVVQIIRDNNLTVMSVSARYVTAYSKMRKADWWDKSKQGGPIVEQATHFCDLCRYLGGEVIMDSIRATALEHNEPAGKLSHFTDAIDESKISVENRIPRATTAFW
jgi:predicted dehydrogenase